MLTFETRLKASNSRWGSVVNGVVSVPFEICFTALNSLRSSSCSNHTMPETPKATGSTFLFHSLTTVICRLRFARSELWRISRVEQVVGSKVAFNLKNSIKSEWADIGTESIWFQSRLKFYLLPEEHNMRRRSAINTAQ